jgi:hypothetical protein
MARKLLFPFFTATNKRPWQRYFTILCFTAIKGTLTTKVHGDKVGNNNTDLPNDFESLV